MKLAAFPISSTRSIFTKLLAVSESSTKNEDQLILGNFINSGYFSSYLQTITFGWKRDCAISSKLKCDNDWPRPFQKALINFFKVHEKGLFLSDPFNLRLLLSF